MNLVYAEIPLGTRRYTGLSGPTQQVRVKKAGTPFVKFPSSLPYYECLLNHF